MRISRDAAMTIWRKRYGDALFASDFHGNLMYRDAYGDREWEATSKDIHADSGYYSTWGVRPADSYVRWKVCYNAGASRYGAYGRWGSIGILVNERTWLLLSTPPQSTGTVGVKCGWNLHHRKPVALGGKTTEGNLECTNIATNEAAGDKITFWVEDQCYQVHRDEENGGYTIDRITDE